MPRDNDYHFAMDRIYDLLNQLGFDVRLSFIIVGILFFISVCHLLFSKDKRFSYSLVFQNIWLQRLCRILFVVAMLLAAVVLYRSPQIYESGQPLVVGGIQFVFFLIGVWIFWMVLDLIWLILIIIFNAIRSFFGWIW